jgi:ribonuclease-3
VKQQALLEKKLGYQFHDPKLFEQALTHRSAKGQHNERLEFLGDTILSTIVSKALYLKFSQATEGELSRMRSLLVCGPSLAAIAHQFELGDFIQLGTGELKSGGFRRESILENTFEAIIGAIYLDSDFLTTESLLLVWFASRLEAIDPSQAQKDPKTRLQEHLQQHKHPLPTYEVIATKGKDHNQTFTVACSVVNFIEPITAQGSSRRKAEQEAAAKVLELIHANK